MALINCPECNEEVSDKALKCPKCGFQIKKPKRGFFGLIIKWIFILFNIFMLLWLISGMNASSEVVNQAVTDAEKAGATIGTGLGIMFISSLWFIGDVILGLFVFLTRPKS